MAIQLDHIDGSGMNDLTDLTTDAAQEDQDSGALDCAAGGAGTGTDEHEQDQ